jgi:hypothetical protein
VTFAVAQFIKEHTGPRIESLVDQGFEVAGNCPTRLTFTSDLWRVANHEVGRPLPPPVRRCARLAAVIGTSWSA